MSRPRLAVCLSLASLALLPGVAAAQQPAPQPQPQPQPQTLVAVGSASAEPTPANRRSDASILQAVREAQAEVVPRAVADGRARAQRLAAAAGVTLGALQTISEVPQGPFGPFGSFGETGTFGPGRFCGTVSRFRTRRLSNGRVRRVRIGTRRICRVPDQVIGTVSLTFAVSPPA